MPLDKLKITNIDKPGNSFEVLFNPTFYTFEDGTTWQDQNKNGQRPELQYTGGERTKLSMELFFDTYETGEDVREYTGKVARLLIPTEGNDKRPPKVKLEWGKIKGDIADSTLPFECVLEKLTQKFTLFSGSGLPVRATLNVVFKQFRLPEDELKRNPPRSSFPNQLYTVKAGDTLSGIAATLWKDPAKWRVMAEKNRIDNPRLLATDQALIVPAIR